MTRKARVAAVVLLITGWSVAAGVRADAAGTGWTETSGQSVSGQNFILNAVDVPGPNDVWAVGYRYGTVGGALEFRTVVEHSTGGSFVMVSSPDRDTAPATNFLQDVSSASPADIWAVGWSRPPGGAGRTLIEHWNGSAWSIVTSADPGQFGNILDGVDVVASDDVWAVGARQDTFYQAPLAEHWNGSTWSTVKVPNPAYCTGHSYLTDVSALSATDVWAVGWCTASSRGGEQGYVLHWDGTRWRSGPQRGIPQNSELYGINAHSGGGVWAVGYTRDDGALALRSRVGGSWHRTPLTGTQAQTTLAGVVARSDTSAVAVGAGPSPQPPFAGPAAVRLGVEEATPQRVQVDFGSLRGVGFDAFTGRLWAVGTKLPGSYNVPLIVSRPT